VNDVARLTEIPDEPRLWLSSGDADGSCGRAALGWQEARFAVRRVRGRKMRHKAALFDEFAAALQFPGYFGENWDAFAECLSDLDWVPPGAGYVLIVTEPAQVLRESPADFRILVRTLDSTMMEWAMAVEAGEWWDRPPVPFNVVLEAERGNEDAIAARWRRARANLSRLDTRHRKCITGPFLAGSADNPRILARRLEPDSPLRY
jgi:hypothetical protein